MSGIFKGDSIYKSGGGGGYKDGGALVDGDTIEVKNNSISSYENTSRSVINYYIEVKDGEPLNAIIELTNDVNATVNVYKFVNGVGVLLPNIGGNTVTANNYYTINIIGNSFSIEAVSTPDDDIYEFIDGKMYGFKKIGSVYWCKEDYNGIISTNYSIKNGLVYTKLSDILSHNFAPFRVPTKNDWINLKNYYSPNSGIKLKSSTGWNNGTPGTVGNNSSGLGFLGRGLVSNNNLSQNGQTGYWAVGDAPNVSNVISCNDWDSDWGNPGWWPSSSVDMYYIGIRLVRPV